MKRIILAAAALFSFCASAEIVPVDFSDTVKVLSDGSVVTPVGGVSTVYDDSVVSLQFSFDLQSLEASDDFDPNGYLNMDAFPGYCADMACALANAWTFNPSDYGVVDYLMSDLLAAKASGSTVADMTIDLGTLNVGYWLAFTGLEYGTAAAFAGLDGFGLDSDIIQVLEAPSEDIPVPATLTLFALGLVALGRRQSKKHKA